MTIAMLVLLELCIRIKRESEISVRRRHIWSEYNSICACFLFEYTHFVKGLFSFSKDDGMCKEFQSGRYLALEQLISHSFEK